MISCMSNLKQLGLAVQMYTQDYDEQLPCAWDNVEGNNQMGGWMFYRDFPNENTGDWDPSQSSIAPYVKNTAVFHCPSDASQQENVYAMNALLLSSQGTLGFHVGISLAGIPAPSNTFLLIEEGTNQNRSTDDAYNIPPGNIPTLRHSEGSVFLFCDGHSKWLRTDTVVYPNPAGEYRYEP